VRVLNIIAVLAISALAVGLQAQDAGQPAGKKPDLTALQGCLRTSVGHYTLTEEDGTTHLLSGAANKLGHQVGRQIEVTGKPAIRTLDNTPQGGASSAVEQEVFEVKTVKRLADVCK